MCLATHTFHADTGDRGGDASKLYDMFPVTCTLVQQQASASERTSPTQAAHLSAYHGHAFLLASQCLRRAMTPFAAGNEVDKERQTE